MKDEKDLQSSGIVLLPILRLECHSDVMIETRKYRIIESISDIEFQQKSSFYQVISKDFEILRKMVTGETPKQNVTKCLTILKFAESLKRNVSFASISNEIL